MTYFSYYTICISDLYMDIFGYSPLRNKSDSSIEKVKNQVGVWITSKSGYSLILKQLTNTGLLTQLKNKEIKT